MCCSAIVRSVVHYSILNDLVLNERVTKLLERESILKLPISWRERFWEWLQPERRLIREYNAYLLMRHRDFDVKGLTTRGIYTLELERVFVDLGLGFESQQRAKPSASAFQVEGDVLSNPIRASADDNRKGRYDLWAFLTAKKMQGKNFVIIGPPGCGKTTLLKYVTLVLAAQKQVRKDVHIDKMPILLFLRDHAASIAQNPNFTLEEAIQGKLMQWGIERPSGWFEQRLRRGECLVLLDGLDEVADAEMRKLVVAWVQRQMEQYANNRFIMSSRPFGYRSNPLPDVMVLEVRPFTIQQVQKFVHNWYKANEIMAAQRDDPGVRMKAHEGAEDLINRLRQVSNLLDMAVNPLLLTMIATVHRYRSSLPGRRVELYAEICEVFLGKRQQAKGLAEELTPAQKQRVLQPLAYHMMYHNEREILWAEILAAIQEPLAQVNTDIAPEAFLAMIVNSSGLIIEREVGIYSFSHLTFQEYLAAAHVYDQREEKMMLKKVEDSWWHEAIRLYAAQAEATNIIKACLARPHPSVKALTLAMECLEEAREVSPQLRTVFDKLAQSVEHENPEVRRIAAEVRLALRLRRMLRADERRYVDSTYVSHAEYQLFLNEEYEDGRFRAPEHWSGESFTAGQGQKPVVGVRPADVVAFCQWLSERESSNWLYRPAHPADVKLISQIQLADSVENNHLRPGYWVATQDGYRCHIELPPPIQNQFDEELQERLASDWDLHHRTEYSHETVERAHQLILSRARQRGYTLLDLEREFPRAPELAAARERVLDRRTRPIANDLDKAIERVLTQLQRLQLQRISDLQLDDVMAYAEIFIHTMYELEGLATARDKETVHEALQQLQMALDHAVKLAQNRQMAVYQELTRALMMALKYVRGIVVILDRAVTRARTRVRTAPLLHIVDLLFQMEQNPDEGTSRRIRYALDDYIDFYLDFAILEERRSSQLPALEGIRLVRERH